MTVILGFTFLFAWYSLLKMILKMILMMKLNF